VTSEPLGLIAGNGAFPRLVLDEARRRGRAVLVLAIEGEADALPDDADVRLHWIGLGEVSKAIRLLKEAGIHEAVMAGQVKHNKVFNILKPDLGLLRVLKRLGTRNTTAVLGAVADVLAEEGIQLLDSTGFLTPLIAGVGTLGRRTPSAAEQADIDFGLAAAREVARLDIGQSVVVKGKAVVAVEAMEGTDEAIRRAAQLVGAGLTVVKVARPQQDMRYDVPVVGPRTIDVMREAGATALAVEAGKTLLLERELLIAGADAADIAVWGARA